MKIYKQHRFNGLINQRDDLLHTLRMNTCSQLELLPVIA